jgi:hypothetical protein
MFGVGAAVDQNVVEEDEHEAAETGEAPHSSGPGRLVAHWSSRKA